MKRFFAKATKPFAISTNTTKNPSVATNESSSYGSRDAATTAQTPLHATPGLKPKYMLPAVPHPYPFDHLAVLATPAGLLIRPYRPGHSKRRNPVATHLQIAWRSGDIAEIVDGDTPTEDDWTESVIVYGIVGMLELFSCPYLLVINSRTEVGNVLDPKNLVYSLKGVTSIPLVEDRARKALQALASRNAAIARPSLLPFTPQTVPADDVLSPSFSSVSAFETNGGPDAVPSPKVSFASSTDVRIMTPPLTPVVTRESEVNPGGAYLKVEVGNSIERPSSAQSCRSDISSPSSESSMVTSPVFQTLASRLSFWPRKRPNSVALDSEEESPFDVPMTLNPSSMVEERDVLDKLIANEEEPAKVVEVIVQATAPAPSTSEEKHRELEEKVVRECIRELTKGCMYWAYTFDITRSLQHKQEQIAKAQKQHNLLHGLGALPTTESGSYSPYPKDGEKVSPLAEPYPTLPLWRRVDKQFWWNEWMAKPFVDAGLHSYVLPIMQGYFQTAALTVPAAPELDVEDDVVVDYIIISRRSRHRVGLRYQRRGIDDEAQVANFVETETIMRVEREHQQNIFSYMQIRGSIPLFWSQSGYSLKPPPVLDTDRTHKQHLEALSRHFKRTIPLYGPHTVINLAEHGGREGAITKGFREYVAEFDNKDVQYCEYDFHRETKGMKYENIGKLVESMQRNFEAQGYLWISGDTVLSQQKGVFRVNCIDCLDRTNVVQSAFARYVLNQQLGAVALLTPSITGGLETDLIFNDVWANNGDAISRAYAGTSALKGDFTRTGKRDLSGLLNDGVNSLARMYTSTFSDWFSQAVLDFMLGSRTKSVFSEFLLKLQSTDPRDLIRLSKIRAEAIATATSRVLPEEERLVSGWTLFAPEGLDETVGVKWEEKVLLLTGKALYIVSYDYTLEKVKLYTRVPLGDIVGITKGAYILSPLEEASRDPEQNYGFRITWLTSRQESRASSYSVRNDITLSALSNPNSPVSPTFGSSRRRGTTDSTGRTGALNYPIPLYSPPHPTEAYASTSSIRANTVPTRRNLATGSPSQQRLSASPSDSGPFLSSFATKSSKLVSSSPPSSTSPRNSFAGVFNRSVNSKSPSPPPPPPTPPPPPETSFAAFKVLPVDPARIQRSSSAYSEVSDEMMGAGTCREAGEMIVGTLTRACEDAGSAPGGRNEGFVVDKDIVSLGEAERMTSVYAKMEYGVKRLLWLGG